MSYRSLPVLQLINAPPPAPDPTFTGVRAALARVLAGQPWVRSIEVGSAPFHPSPRTLCREVLEGVWAEIGWDGDEPVRGSFIALALDVISLDARAQALVRERDSIAEQSERVKARMIERNRIEVLGSMAMSIAHDLRSPLTALSNSSAYLEDRFAELAAADITLRELFEDNRLALDSIEGLLAGMRSFSSEGATAGLVPLRSVVTAAVQLTRWCMRRAQLDLLVRIDGEPQGRGSDGEIVQIVVNLLTNAADASPKRSTIHVIARERSPETSTIYVLDEGPGVARAIASTIFEPFHTTKATGMGLGLSIAREMARRSGGELAVCYEPPRDLPRTRGACFVLTLRRE